MANYVIQDTTLTNIADAIREKNGSEDTYKPAEMAEAISAIKAGGSEITIRTPDEIYAQDRPVDWPVLPDPTEDNEFYFLCQTIGVSSTSVTVCYPEPDLAAKAEIGYIDENGEFVVVHTIQETKGVYWGRTGLNLTTPGTEYMTKYHVIRTTGSDTSYDKPNNSTNAGTDTMQYVLEIKARGSDLKFGTAKSEYYKGFINCRFITLYGPQNWRADSSSKFSGLGYLKCLRFDSDENNIFLQPNSKVTNLASLFSSCYCLEYAYPINNFTALTKINSMYSYCRSLKKIALENETVTSISGVIANDYGLIECSIKLPKSTAASLFSSTSGRVHKYTDLDLGGITSPSYIQYVFGYCCEEMLNVKINSSLDYSSYGPAYYSNYGSMQLKRLTMAPDQEGMPASFKVMLYAADKENIKEFLESLPVITTSCALTIFNPALYSIPVEDILSIATNKGYTVSITQ